MSCTPCSGDVPMECVPPAPQVTIVAGPAGPPGPVYAGRFGIPVGSISFQVTGLAIPKLPTMYVVTVGMPSSGSSDVVISGAVDLSTVTADGFVFNLTGPAPTSSYVLAWIAIFN